MDRRQPWGRHGRVSLAGPPDVHRGTGQRGLWGYRLGVTALIGCEGGAVVGVAGESVRGEVLVGGDDKFVVLGEVRVVSVTFGQLALAGLRQQLGVRVGEVGVAQVGDVGGVASPTKLPAPVGTNQT